MATNQVVLVTGASTGFGRLFTETLARKGYTVFATMRDPKGKNAKNAAEIEALAKKESLPIQILELDVTKEDSVDKAFKSVIDKAGRIDVVINNAGFPVVGLMETITVEQAQSQFDTNFFGCVRVNRAALPHMRKQKSGLLLHISSGAGRLVFPTFGLYCASKFALEAFSEAYNYELAGQGIQSVSIQPGAYQTAIFGNVLQGSDNARSETYGVANQILPKISEGLAKNAGNAQEVADAVLRVIETPAAQRKAHYRVSPQDIGVDAINDLCEKTQDSVIQAFGLADDVKFVTASAAAKG
ncbi:MAG TPA: SDR family oxidoreductase [Candidatus Eremiobacteraceae bacterium]|jgi:NAD(P)-dependent dehydrogenase (short-subunit alcohol dehydrogenase family)|nr:SDR family oxidoreductase [Candidatus Eremiobacteraceae bacterium]